MEKLKTTDSTLSFDFATEDHLQFQMLSEQAVELFPKLDCKSSNLLAGEVHFEAICSKL